ncbi:hypothetical protein CEXT_535871 [Caerostris extrusa]|uniref:Uncharacterized protein n=1 Tax=Caerostris extrusa TaxID=172846 RepID=A0AAV4W1T6_CAEEX|nr:hypothetical protein CEXT_535871 [Caerostris extrusa]
MMGHLQCRPTGSGAEEVAPQTRKKNLKRQLVKSLTDLLVVPSPLCCLRRERSCVRVIRASLTLALLMRGKKLVEGLALKMYPVLCHGKVSFLYWDMGDERHRQPPCRQSLTSCDKKSSRCRRINSDGLPWGRRLEIHFADNSELEDKNDRVFLDGLIRGLLQLEFFRYENFKGFVDLAWEDVENKMIKYNIYYTG